MRFVLIFLLSINLFAGEYFVSKVMDGDTIQVRKGKKKTKVRLYGIDAPETSQNFGAYCTRVLSSKIIGKKVDLKIKGKDKYKRTIAIVYLDEVDINRYMVQQGCAWAYSYYTNMYKSDELKARQELKGLWIDKNAQNPYEWTKKHKNRRSESEELKKLLQWLIA